MSLEDTAVSSTASDPDIAVFQQQRAAAAGAGPEDEEEDEDEVSEARSAPPVVEHDREEISEEEVDAMEQEAEQAVPQVDTLLLMLFVSTLHQLQSVVINHWGFQLLFDGVLSTAGVINYSYQSQVVKPILWVI
jgi:hypothetical protein